MPCNVPEGLNPDGVVSEKPKMPPEGATSINIEIIFRKFCNKQVVVLKNKTYTMNTLHFVWYDSETSSEWQFGGSIIDIKEKYLLDLSTQARF